MGDSPVWADLLKVKQIYLRGRQIITKNGKQTLFWKEKWLYDQPLCTVAPVLFEWCEEKNITANQFLMKNGQLQFNRWLPPIFFEQWLNIIDKVYNYEFNINNDVIKWKWGGKGKFTTKSVYDHLTQDDDGFHFSHIWKSKIPYKVKIFTWLLENNAVLTKNNMVKRKWSGHPICMFCNQNESANHLFFQCCLASFIWGVIGACFGRNTSFESVIKLDFRSCNGNGESLDSKKI
jgi:hypothetical protein